MTGKELLDTLQTLPAECLGFDVIVEVLDVEAETESLGEAYAASIIVEGKDNTITISGPEIP